MTAYTVAAGQAPTFAVGSLTFQIDGSNAASPLREDILKYVFIKTVPAWFNETTPHTGPTNLYLSFHEGNPFASDESPVAGQTASEITPYTGYVRTAVIRTVSGWTVADAGSGAWGAKNAAVVTFTANAGAAASIADLWIGLGTEATGVGELLFAFQYNATTVNCASDNLESDILAMVLQGTSPTWVTGETVGAYAGMYMSAYTVAYAHGDTQLTNEVDTLPASVYTGFARGQTGVFTTTTVSGDYANVNFANINLYSGAGLTNGGSTTPGYWRIGSASTGAGRVLLHGAATNPPIFVNGGTPKYLAGNVVIQAS